MIDYTNLTTTPPIINYDTTMLTNNGYELKFALDFENPELENVINKCKKDNHIYKIVDSGGRQKHVWIKDWVGN